MIELQLERDRRSAPTLVEQLVQGFAEAIEAQALRSGAQLPSVRQLAQTYQLSTFTVMEAYNRLVSKGLVVARRGSGHRVATLDAPAPRVSASDWQPPSLTATWLLSDVYVDHSVPIKAGCGW
ncbi:MAG: winged helix-turn-helix transcriptional regulator, partial [Paraburkholderia sp.]|nr:winged helix-turn-helix transcriptional regulator [Paraburkholderia sp.]